MGRGSSKAGGGSKVTMIQPENWYYNQLTDAEKTEVVNAQYNTKELNRYLRGDTTGMSDSLKENLKNRSEILDKALAKYETQKEMVTYRGMSAEEFTNTYLGIEKVTKGVKSTSYDPERAEAFAKNQGGYIIEYHIKPGHYGADVNGVPGANEKEFLIRNNMPQKVVQKIGKNRLVVEVG